MLRGPCGAEDQTWGSLQQSLHSGLWGRWGVPSPPLGPQEPDSRCPALTLAPPCEGGCEVCRGQRASLQGSVLGRVDSDQNCEMGPGRADEAQSRWTRAWALPGVSCLQLPGLERGGQLWEGRGSKGGSECGLRCQGSLGGQDLVDSSRWLSWGWGSCRRGRWGGCARQCWLAPQGRQEAGGWSRCRAQAVFRELTLSLPFPAGARAGQVSPQQGMRAAWQEVGAGASQTPHLCSGREKRELAAGGPCPHRILLLSLRLTTGPTGSSCTA